jgi:transcriptional regulator with XRE-family HTH domain
MSDPHKNGSLIAARHLMITQRLRDRRDELGLTQKQIVTRLARCGLQTTNRALSSLEHGAGLDVAKLPELALALDCTVTYLIGLTEDPHRWEPDVAAVLPTRPARAAIPPAAPVPAPAASVASVARRVEPPASPGRSPATESLILGAYVPDRGVRRRQPG